MVKLRSGYIYIDTNLFNLHLDKLNKFIKGNSFRIKNNIESKLFKEILITYKFIKIRKNHLGNKYFIHKNNEKIFDENKILWRSLVEDLWLMISKFIIIFKKKKKIKKKNKYRFK